MKSLIILFVLISSSYSYAGSCMQQSFYQNGRDAVLDLKAIEDLTGDRNGLFNNRNVCYYLGRLQANVHTSMKAGLHCFSQLEKPELLTEATMLHNDVSNFLDFCHDKLSKSKAAEIKREAVGFRKRIEAIIRY